MPRKKIWTPDEVADHAIKELGRGGLQEEVRLGFTKHFYRPGRLYYHTTDSRNSPKGYPDVAVLEEGEQVIIELKVGDNKPSDEQIEWLLAYKAAGAHTFVLWPRHRPILSLLYQGRYYHSLVRAREGVYTKGAK